jgi:hypothetical protein
VPHAACPVRSRQPGTPAAGAEAEGTTGQISACPWPIVHVGWLHKHLTCCNGCCQQPLWCAGASIYADLMRHAVPAAPLTTRHCSYNTTPRAAHLYTALQQHTFTSGLPPITHTGSCGFDCLQLPAPGHRPSTDHHTHEATFKQMLLQRGTGSCSEITCRTWSQNSITSRSSQPDTLPGGWAPASAASTAGCCCCPWPSAADACGSA